MYLPGQTHLPCAMPLPRSWSWGRFRLLFLCLAMGCLFYSSMRGAEAVSFKNDVMAVLSKAGCSAGACHGNANGKGGLKLSLRGQDPGRDYTVLVEDWLGRRIDRLNPENSLLLLKPTTSIAHEGGKRFGPEDVEYQLLHQWILAGVKNDLETAPSLTSIQVTPEKRVLVEPDQGFQIRVTARFNDGSSKDVTRLSVYETSEPLATISPDGQVQREEFGELTIIARYLHLQEPIRVAFVPERPEFVWSHPEPLNRIDEFIDARLRELRMNPSGIADDRTFMRRAWLDIAGRVPPPEVAIKFLESKETHKRQTLVRELLDSNAFADYWALKWSDLLRNEEKVLDRKGVQAFHRWIRQQIRENRPINEFIGDILAGTGSSYHKPQSNFYRSIREPRQLGEAVARVVMGTRLQCAQCHNHPFDRWTQNDYYNWSAVFAPVSYKVLENRRRDGNDKHEFVGEQVIWVNPDQRIKNAATGDNAVPAFLDTPNMDKTEKSVLADLAEWATSPNNRPFARAQVNRIWFHLMGRGLVDPVDDFRATNPPSHPELLEWLTDHFIENDFDLRFMIRLITSSRAYQVASIPDETDTRQDIHYSHNRVRRIQAEVLLDAMADVASSRPTFNGYPAGMRAVQIPGVEAIRARYKKPSKGDQFLKAFGKPPRLICSEEERSDVTSMSQAFQLIGGPAMDLFVTDPKNRLTDLLSSNLDTKQIIEDLYMNALSRRPDIIELEEMTRHLEAASTRRAGLEDILWALLNSKEFLFRP